MQKWEHKIATGDLETVYSTIILSGNDGWELITVIRTDNVFTTYQAFFKRMKNSKSISTIEFMRSMINEVVCN